MNKEYGVKCTLNILLTTFRAEDICAEISDIISQLVMGLEMDWQVLLNSVQCTEFSSDISFYGKISNFAEKCCSLLDT